MSCIVIFLVGGAGQPENPQRGTQNTDPLPNPWNPNSSSATNSSSPAAPNPFR